MVHLAGINNRHRVRIDSGDLTNLVGRVLVTGFEPFGGFTINPSAVIAESLDGEQIGDSTVFGRVVPLDYRRALDIVQEYIRETRPTHILSCGQSYNAGIALERIAINAVSTTRPDNYDFVPDSDIILPDAPAGLFGTINPHPIVKRLSDVGVHAFVSYHAGTYGCNWLYFNLLAWAYRGDLNARVLFVHVPPLPDQVTQKPELKLPSMKQEDQLNAIRLIIESIADSPG